MKNIRNFSIIAHIDHGKSTLSSCIINHAYGKINKFKITEQVLDSMDLERERGITIKAQSASLDYKSSDGEIYKLNIIDTPGHVDFSYEVSRSLAAVEGALLVVDASQGVEAQTLANCYAAIDMNLKVIPVLNKIDLMSADPDRVAREIEDIIGIYAKDAVRCSAKTGIGVIELLDRLVHDLPPPEGNPASPLQALIIDSWFDKYLGVVSLVRIKNGVLRKKDKIKVMSTGLSYDVNSMGIFNPKCVNTDILYCGEVGWISCSIKDILGAPVGDTLTLMRYPAKKSLPGFKKSKPQVYAGMFPSRADDYASFYDALGKLSLNDASLFYEPESSRALGCGFRCGFLGLLHMEIIQERLKREYSLDIITTAPTVIYKLITIDNKILYVDNPSKLPPLNTIKTILEPIAKCHILLPQEHLGNVITLCIEKRGLQTDMVYHGNQISLSYNIPMAEVVSDFFDRLKSTSRGYASLEYTFSHFTPSAIVSVDLLINNERIDALTLITHRDHAQYRGQKLVDKLCALIPRQHFDIAIQASLGNHIISRSTVKQLRKNVIAKCYGGDVSRKKKLLQKQKDGKKRMKQVGNVELPKEVFLATLYIGTKNKHV